MNIYEGFCSGMNCMLHVNRRATLKAVGAGMVGGAAIVGKVTAGDHSSFELLHFAPGGATAGNITRDPETNGTVMLEGSGSFDPSGDGPASGGGTFEFRDAARAFVGGGEWDADSTEHWEEFGRNNEGQVGGHLELLVTLTSQQGTNPLGDGPGHELDIFCMIEHDPGDGHTSGPDEAEEGFDLGSYTEQQTGATLFNVA